MLRSTAPSVVRPPAGDAGLSSPGTPRAIPAAVVETPYLRQPTGLWGERVPGWARLICVPAGLVMLGLLVTAFRLTPSPTGMETHTQLGLAKCAAVQLFGIRCPSCGMTTSWAYLTKGNVIGALSANTGGTLLGLAVMIVGPYLLVAGLVGRWPYSRPNEAYVAVVAGTILTVTLIDWTLRLTGLL